MRRRTLFTFALSGALAASLALTGCASSNDKPAAGPPSAGASFPANRRRGDAGPAPHAHHFVVADGDRDALRD